MNTERELFNKLKPALRCKKNELIRNKIEFVKEMDIWNYNKENNWKNVHGLTISKMVDDILNTEDTKYYNYSIKKIRESD